MPLMVSEEVSRAMKIMCVHASRMDCLGVAIKILAHGSTCRYHARHELFKFMPGSSTWRLRDAEQIRPGWVFALGKARAIVLGLGAQNTLGNNYWEQLAGHFAKILSGDMRSDGS